MGVDAPDDVIAIAAEWAVKVLKALLSGKMQCDYVVPDMYINFVPSVWQRRCSA